MKEEAQDIKGTRRKKEREEESLKIGITNSF